MDIKQTAKDIFETTDWITGTLTGGIEAPRIILNIKEDGDTISIVYTHPELSGYPDCRYHDTRAGKTDTVDYKFDGYKVFANGKLDIFSAEQFKYDADITNIINGFYAKHTELANAYIK